MFQSASGSVHFPSLEAEVGQFWKDRRIYEESLKRRAGSPRFVFYEGPPTANGLPHPGHCLTRAIKDLFPRYRTMRGYLCERKGGWDTHGLPVEVEVCKELGIHSKDEIEQYGIEPFIQRCQQSVWRYIQDWRQLTERIGFWVHLDEAYVTYHQSYVESVWWSLRNLFERGLLYQGHKIVWWWAQGGTALSAGEVGQGYREVADPSVYVKFPIVQDERAKQLGLDDNTSLLVWTTTPWTLPSNQFAAVHPELEYAVVEVSSEDAASERLIVASALVETIATKAKVELQVERTLIGSELVDMRFRPPIPEVFYDNTLPGTNRKHGELTRPLKDGRDEYVGWRMIAADFVTIDSGTGIVHLAPPFGEVDYECLKKEQSRFDHASDPRLLNPVEPNGNFWQQRYAGVGSDNLDPAYADWFHKYSGRWVKDCDRDIIRDLKARGLLFHQEQYVHEYPFCWRSEEDPLIQYPRESWFVRTTQFKDRMVANNRLINWLPEYIRDGRFGNFLESNVDWALSRERYWGTPLPIWQCEQTGRQEAIGSYAELLEKPGVDGTQAWENARQQNPELPEDLKVHKPYIDQVTYDSPFAPGSRMRRVTEVIDCWYDSGAMPFAQWGYPHAGREQFGEQFPADFISEAIDQTRGWFYSQLAISTLLFSEDEDAGAAKADTDTPDELRPSAAYPHPFRNCVVLGLMLGEDGQKMSKSKRNYREPAEIFDRYGADALRWYFFANQPPWTTIRYSEQAIKDSIPEFLLRLWNVYSFFVIYANIDGFDPATDLPGDVGDLPPEVLAKAPGYRPLAKRGELDRWIVSELNKTVAAVVERMDAYDNFAACQRITAFVDALSNWYVRRSRDRFWSGEVESAEKRDAYWTLYECLLTTCKMIAPFVPFLADACWRNLAGVFGERATESVHLCDYPEARGEVVDRTLSECMETIREITSLGRAARMSAKLKVRQPLAKVEVILADTTHQAWLLAHAELIREELNVKQVEFTQQAEQYITYTVVPDFKRLGPRLGRQMPEAKKALSQSDGGRLLAELRQDGKFTLELPGGAVTLDEEDVQVRLQAKEGWAAAQGARCVVVLATELTDELIQEGYVRDVVRSVQERRKELGCEFTDRIELGLVASDEHLAAALERFGDYIATETLATKLTHEPLNGAEAKRVQVADFELEIYLRVAQPG